MVHIPSPGRPALPSLLFHCSSNSRNEPERPQQQGGSDGRSVMRCSPSTQTTTPLVPTDLRALFPKELRRRSEKHPTLGSPNAPTPTKPKTKKKIQTQTKQQTHSAKLPSHMHAAPVYQARTHARTHPPPFFMSKNLTLSMDWCKYTYCQRWYLIQISDTIVCGRF
jgi:hypothetical protein